MFSSSYELYLYNLCFQYFTLIQLYRYYLLHISTVCRKAFVCIRHYALLIMLLCYFVSILRIAYTLFILYIPYAKRYYLFLSCSIFILYVCQPSNTPHPTLGHLAAYLAPAKQAYYQSWVQLPISLDFTCQLSTTLTTPSRGSPHAPACWSCAAQPTLCLS